MAVRLTGPDKYRKDPGWQHPWLRVERLLRAILTEEWSAEAWRQLRQEIVTVLAERSWLRRVGWFN